MLFPPPLPPDVRYLPQALARREADRVFALLLQEANWAERSIVVYNREYLQPRLVALMADAPELTYTYSKTKMEPAAWTPTAAALRDLAQQQAGCEFNTCLLNLYRNGRDSMGWHADSEPELGPEPVIASWSFGATRTFSFRHRATKETLSLELNHGDLLLMAGRTQAEWLHALPRRLRVDEPRLNLTFRQLKSVR